MDGLRNRLVGDSLGHPNKDDQLNSDERSTPTWAQVVSGDQDDDKERGDRRKRHNRNQCNSQEQEWGAEGWRISKNRPREEQYRSEQELEHDSSRFMKMPQKLDGDEDDGWQTVGKKPPRRQHKVPKDHWHGYKLPPSEQHYSNDVEIDVITIEPSEEELADLSQACSKPWDLDLNRLVPGKDYEIDCGGGKRVYQKEDMAPKSLFSWVSDEVFRKPTFSRFCSLLDNYNPYEESMEVVTFEEKQEQDAFLEEISRTAPIQYLRKYLACKGIGSGSYQGFKRMMSSLWFDLYNRGGTFGSSSAFEHVFVGEIKQSGQISGFHNWLQYYLEEANGRVDYQGYRYSTNVFCCRRISIKQFKYAV